MISREQLELLQSISVTDLVEVHPTAQLGFTTETEVAVSVEKGGRTRARQVETLGKLVSEYFRRHCYGQPQEYELKRVDVRVLSYDKVAVILEVGLRNDRGTLASVFCRKRVMVFIGRNGGCCAKGRVSPSSPREEVFGIRNCCSRSEM